MLMFLTVQQNSFVRSTTVPCLSRFHEFTDATMTAPSLLIQSDTAACTLKAVQVMEMEAMENLRGKRNREASNKG